MNVPAFSEKEMQPKGTTFSMTGPIPLYSFPVSMKEAYVSAVRDRKPIWQITGIEARLFTPSIIPDNVARAFVFEGKPFDNANLGGGKDMFGVEWEYIPTAGGSMEKPDVPHMLEDMNDWPEKIKFPDLDSWDWAQSAKDNANYVSGDTAIQVWHQTGWFERIISFMGFEGAALALIDDEQQDAVKAFFDKLADLYIDLIDHYVHYFPQIDAFYMHDDWGSQKETFFSPSVVAEMIVPSMRKVTDHIHKLGRITELHSCGQIMRQVPNIIAAGWDTWGGQAMNDTQALYDQYGDQIVISVIPDQFDPATTSEEEQREYARRFAEKFCNPKKPCTINHYGSAVLTPAYREELYRQSRILFSK